ncbi:MAG TPA: ABC transporter permease [Kofleriaceae bacterium]|nr:ABC transporter permease [Kofleriaceae bacterium]
MTEAPGPGAARGPGDLLRRARAGSPGATFGLLALLAALVVTFSILLPGRFLTAGTAQSMMFQLPELGLLALAMAIPLVSGGLNLAIIATTNQCALLMAWIMKSSIGPGTGAAEALALVVLAMLAGLALCALIGFIAGLLIANTGVHPILVTLGLMSLVDGISIDLTRGTVVSGFPDAFQVLGNATLVGIPVPFLILAAVAVAVALGLTRTTFGISVYMIGSNLEATRYSGIDVKRVLVGVYTLSGALCFIAACLMMARFNSASAGYAQSYLLITILAAVLGGIDPFGGFGRISGLMIALVVLQVIASGFNLLGLSQHLTLAIWGLTLIAVMAIKFLLAPFLARGGGPRNSQ